MSLYPLAASDILGAAYRFAENASANYGKAHY
jgi:hypothetical protein